VTTHPRFAGRTVEIWKRQKDGTWVVATKRLVAADGSVHYYTRINAWTALLAKLEGATSHGRVATPR
jgi:hypothetical protein